ncbi:hypothetical protein HNV12_01580 [Methanococcoides sp. SA1]|nr:hypothetical protein [Methanococcoides sp. SA1]
MIDNVCNIIWYIRVYRLGHKKSSLKGGGGTFFGEGVEELKIRDVENKSHDTTIHSFLLLLNK